MKENIYYHIKWLAQYCGGAVDLAVLSNEDVNSLMPTLMSKLKEQSNAIGYDGFKGDPNDYPQIVWVMVYNAIVKPTVLEWVDENCPKAWFRPMYLPKDEQDKLLKNKS